MFIQTYNTISYLAVSTIVALGLLVGCDAFLDDIGGLGQDCTSKGVCEKGLVCSSGTCIKDSDAELCSGSCNEQSEPTKCANSDDLCACVDGTWKFYYCDNICNDDGLQSNGCGIPSGGTYPYCLCDESSSDGDGTTDGDDTIPPGEFGGACSYNGECETNQCLTTESLQENFLVQAEVKNGYCTLFPCDTESTSDSCSTLYGGNCFSLYLFMGEGYETSGICLRDCNSDSDCRKDENYVCLDPYSWVRDGYLDAEVVSILWGGSNKYCMPGDLVDEIEALFESMSDGDWDSSTTNTDDNCSGACDATRDISFCVDDDVCICESGDWTLYTCSNICSTSYGTSSNGCGWNDEYEYHWCDCAQR